MTTSGGSVPITWTARRGRRDRPGDARRRPRPRPKRTGAFCLAVTQGRSATPCASLTLPAPGPTVARGGTRVDAFRILHIHRSADGSGCYAFGGLMAKRLTLVALTAVTGSLLCVAPAAHAVVLACGSVVR